MSNGKARVTGAALWRQGTPWWIVLGEGVILVALGLHILFAGSSANTLLAWGAALALLAGGTLRCRSGDQLPGPMPGVHPAAALPALSS